MFFREQLILQTAGGPPAYDSPAAFDCRRAPASPRRNRFVTEPNPAQNEQQRRYREFLDLLPLTLSLAGLPPSEPGRYFNEEQIETRLFAVRHAYKASRNLVRELVAR